MKDLLLSLQSEFYKSRKTLGFWSVIIIPVVVCLLVAAGFYFNSSKLASMPGMAVWTLYSGILFSIVSGMWLSMMVIFVCYSVNSIEHKADSWKTLFSLPTSKWAVYSAKLIYASLLIGIYLSLFLAFTVVLGNLLGILKPDLHFADHHMEGLLTKRYIKLFLSSLGILSIQFLLSLLWANFLKPMGVGFICTIIGSILTAIDWKYVYLFPYASPSLTTRGSIPIRKPGTAVETTVDIFTDNIYVSLIVFAIFFVAGFYLVQKKSVK